MLEPVAGDLQFAFRQVCGLLPESVVLGDQKCLIHPDREARTDQSEDGQGDDGLDDCHAAVVAGVTRPATAQANNPDRHKTGIVTVATRLESGTGCRRRRRSLGAAPPYGT